MSARTRPWGALFDWDGVILDSRAAHEAAWNAVAAEFGFPHSRRDFEKHFGCRNEHAIREILSWTQDAAVAARISSRKETLFREQIAACGEPFFVSSLDFVVDLSQQGVPCAVVSSTSRQNLEEIGHRHSIARYFRAFVSAEDVSRGKPDPEGYLLGAYHLGLSSDRCVVFEDAPLGVEAGRRAGMYVVGLATTHPAEALRGADRVVRALDQDLAQVLRARFTAAP